MTDLISRIGTVAGRTRRRIGWVDHTIRAGIRYDQVDGGRLAAAMTYYAFFAVFAGGLLAFSIFGFFLDRPSVLTTVDHYLAGNLPRLDVNAIRDNRGSVGVVGFLVLLVSGLFWVDATRSSIRAIWRLDEYPGGFFRRRLVDLAIFIALGLLIAQSLTVSWGTNALMRWMVVDAGNVDGSLGTGLLRVAGFLIGLALNASLAAAMLTVVPRLHICRHRVVPAALLIAVGAATLNTVGQVFVRRAEANPAYQVVAVAVGLLVFLSLLNQLVLFAAAWTATSTHGSVRVLSGWKLLAVDQPRTIAGNAPRRHWIRRTIRSRPSPN